MSYTKKFYKYDEEGNQTGHIIMNIEQWSEHLWMARNPRLSVGYSAHTYDEVVARVEEQMELHPENFIEKTDAEIWGMTEEEYQEMRKNHLKSMKGEI